MEEVELGPGADTRPGPGPRTRDSPPGPRTPTRSAGMPASRSNPVRASWPRRGALRWRKSIRGGARHGTFTGWQRCFRLTQQCVQRRRGRARGRERGGRPGRGRRTVGKRAARHPAPPHRPSAAQPRRPRRHPAGCNGAHPPGTGSTASADIAAHAGVSAALVHYHFTGRDRLPTGTLVYPLTRAEARLESRTQGTDRDTPAEGLADLIDYGLPRAHDDVLECRLWSELEIRSTGSGQLTAALTELRRRIPTPLVATVEDGLNRGDFHDCAPRRGYRRNGAPRRPDQPAPHRPRCRAPRRRPPPGRTPARTRDRLSRPPPLPAPRTRWSRAPKRSATRSRYCPSPPAQPPAGRTK